MRWNLYTAVPLFVALSLMSGCMGLGDLFAQRRTIAGDFRLQRFEGGDLYLMVSGESGSVAGPISRIG